MERVDLLLLARVEAEMEVLRRRPPFGDVQVREARPALAFRDARDAERSQHRLVETNALRVVARVDVDVVEEPERPVPVH
jgi:hypothetical protein